MRRPRLATSAIRTSSKTCWRTSNASGTSVHVRACAAHRPANPLNRWNTAVTPALELVDAYAHSQAAQALLDAANQAPHPEAQRQLRLLHRLFTLRRVAAHSGDLLAEGYLTSAQVRQLPDAAESVVGDLAPEALTLTNGFAVVEDVLRDHPINHPDAFDGIEGSLLSG